LAELPGGVATTAGLFAAVLVAAGVIAAGDLPLLLAVAAELAWLLTVCVTCSGGVLPAL
jgi:hypothetical protein